MASLDRHLKNKGYTQSIYVNENLVRPNRCWKAKRNSFAWLAVVSAQTKLGKYQRRPEEEILWKSGKLEVITQNFYFKHIEQFHELFSPFLQLANFKNIEQNVVLTARVMIIAAFE